MVQERSGRTLGHSEAKTIEIYTRWANRWRPSATGKNVPSVVLIWDTLRYKYMKYRDKNMIYGAAKKTRTSTGFLPQRPQRCASTSSATTAPSRSKALAGPREQERATSNRREPPQALCLSRAAIGSSWASSRFRQTGLSAAHRRSLRGY